MKKSNVVRDAILGGCLGLILFEIGMYIYKLITQGFTQEIITDSIEHIGIFLVFSFWFAIFSIVFSKQFDETKQLTLEEKEKTLRKMRYYILIAGFFTTVLGLASIILKSPHEVSIIIFSGSFSLLILFLGTHFGYISSKKQKKDIINQNIKKDKEIHNKKSLIIYFSRTDENYFEGKLKYIDKGNTEIVAEYIKELTGADLFKVERKIPYSADYKICLEESREENKKGERPELVKYLDNIDKYDLIYIGGPVYFGILPAPMVTQLEKLNFQDKIVKPFTTHEGSGLGLVPDQLRKICVGAQMKYGLAIKGSEVKNSKDKIEKWILSEK